MRKWYRRLTEPIGASDVVEPYRAAIAKIPGVVKVRAIVRERRSTNERLEFTITLFSDFKDGEMRATVVDEVMFALHDLTVQSRLLHVKPTSFTVIAQRPEKLRLR